MTKFTDIFVEKIREAFAMQKFSHFFNQKYWHISDINIWNFNETLTNNVVGFEQPGPDLSRCTDDEIPYILFELDS